MLWFYKCVYLKVVNYKKIKDNLLNFIFKINIKLNYICVFSIFWE